MLLEADLPSDPQGLRDILAATMAELAALRVAGKETQAQIDDLRADRAAARAEIVRLNAVNDHAEAELVRLHDIIAALRRHRFGARSEKLDDEQLEMAFEDTETALGLVAASLDAVAVTPREPRRRKTNRGRLPAHLERVEQIVDIENKACGCCGGTLHVIGEDVAERLDVVFDASTTDIRAVVVHSHRQPTEDACLSCIYRHVPDEHARERAIADGLGISLDMVRESLISADAAALIAAANAGIQPAAIEGMAYDSLFKQLCAEQALKSAEGKQVLAPFAFVSALAGGLLVVEMLRVQAGVDDTNYWQVGNIPASALAFGRARPVNECLKLGDEQGGLNVHLWVAAAANPDCCAPLIVRQCCRASAAPALAFEAVIQERSDSLGVVEHHASYAFSLLASAPAQQLAHVLG